MDTHVVDNAKKQGVLLLLTSLLLLTEKETLAKDPYPEYAFSKDDSFIAHKVLRMYKGKL